jgi:hypothetical protein
MQDRSSEVLEGQGNGVDAANQRYWIARGDWRGARVFSDRGLALGPNDPFLLANRARLEYETGNPTVGETYLRRYVERLKLDLEAPPDRAAYQDASVASVLPLICRLVEVSEWLDLAETAAHALLDSPRVSAEWRFRAASCLGLVATVRGDSIGARECYEQLTETLNPDPESTVVFCRGSLTFVQAQLARVAYPQAILTALLRISKLRKEIAGPPNTGRSWRGSAMTTPTSSSRQAARQRRTVLLPSSAKVRHSPIATACCR